MVDVNIVGQVGGNDRTEVSKLLREGDLCSVREDDGAKVSCVA